MSASTTASADADAIPPKDPERASTGVAGLDEILGGGLTRKRVYLLEGTPGTGKTTFALRFLIEGARRGERGLYITLSETTEELAAVVASHGWSLDGIDVFELADEGGGRDPDAEQSILYPSEVELGETIRSLTAQIERAAPVRVVFDSLSEMRLLAQDPLRYRRQVLALKQFFSTRACTVLLLDDKTSEPGDLQLHSISHGVISLEQAIQQFGTESRRLRVVKMRGQKFQGGLHDFILDTGRVAVFPRLVASRHRMAVDHEQVGTGSSQLDQMLGGGLTRGTSTLLLGPSGVGKTTTAVHCMHAALQRGERATYYLFDEGLSTLLLRSRMLGMDIEPFVASGACRVVQVDPAELSPGEFASLVVDAVSNGGSSFIAIDSLNAYLQAMPGQSFLLLHMHELLDLPQPPRGDDDADRRPARQPRRSAHRDRPQLPRRRDPDVQVLRGRRRGALGDHSGQEPNRPERANHPRIPSQPPRGPADRRADRRLRGRDGRDAALRRRHQDDGRPHRMSASATPGAEQRVLVHAPRGRDAQVVSQVLQAQAMHAEVCDSLEQLTEALGAGAGIAFVTEESLAGPALAPLAERVAQQPPWSDFPFIVLVARRVGRRPSGASGALAKLGNVVLLERPLNADTLVSAARSALRARDRQYQTRRHLVEQEQARIAERIASAEASRANEALEVAVEAGELGTFHCPWPLRVIEWNAKCKEHFWLPADAQVDFDLFYSLIHDDDRDQVRAAIDAAVAGGADYDIEYRTVSRAGAERWIRAKGQVYRDRSGEPTRFDGVTLDISRQKRFEEEREALLAAERQARLEAERASRMKDEFLATLSHELRTPLSAILGWTHLLGRAGAPAVDVAKAAATIERNARAQARLIEELLDVSRITSGNLHLDIQPVSIAAVFETVLSSLKPAADARSIALHQLAAEAAGEVLADASRLQQIVWNLVSNAIKFTAPGGQVTLSARRSESEVTLTVSDTGAGIAPDFLPHVFERFRQAESSESRSHGGLGLGLAIVRQLVELHGGKAEAASAGVGRGATFTVHLPLHSRPVAPAAAPATSPATAPAPAPETLDADLTGTRILVVDDEADGREMLTRMLESWGAEVRAAGSAEEAIEAINGEAPDLLISDIGMPRVDGYELMRRIRAMSKPERRDMPAIALTAFARGEDAAKARQAGYGVHLPKPVDPSRLLTTIASVLAAAT